MQSSTSAQCGRGACISFEPGPTTIAKPPTTWIPSPNFGTRDSSPVVDSVVIHTTEVDLAGPLNIFQTASSQVSAHFVIAPNGTIYEMVEPSKRAWHATYYNSRSIGIEMVGFAGFRSTWNERNLSSLENLLAWILQAYPQIPLIHPVGDAYDFPSNQLNVAGIVAHAQVQPWNRSDPGQYFPWNQTLDAVGKQLAVPEPRSLALCGMLTFFVRSPLARRRT
ncbi:N-acetylmuramoyl-L-alanine amidase [Bythopirellula polymerisocia]|uniref:N-acetylmuramoyl-L-alanine amidase n=1 Tax=Bythopirellula polymerisocia TaxID=2528003 RepID=UPI0018D3D9EC|nr:N-acetylmuramoyl-L-alanine amidase [Bythopirellula polymerisocia]